MGNGGGVAVKNNLANDWTIVKCPGDAMATYTAGL